MNSARGRAGAGHCTAIIAACLAWPRRLALAALLGACAAAPASAQPDDATLLRRATGLWQLAYYYHSRGALQTAIGIYRKSIDVRPTAEAHTFLGWALSHLDRYQEAIEECRKAIEIDPDFGNPYNDIGAYLIELGRHDEALPWLEQATRAPRYCCYQFAWFNLGRVYLAQGKPAAARRAFERALRYDPELAPAIDALDALGRGV